MNSSRLLSAFILVCLPFLASCYFTSAYPLPPAAAVDPALLGLWQSIPPEDEKDSKGAYLLITAFDQRIWITVFEEPYRASEMYLGYCSEIKQRKYLSVAPSKPVSTGAKMVSEDAYYLVRYAFNDSGHLEIRLLDEEPFRKAVDQKKLAGEVSKDDLHLTASSEALGSFLSRVKLASSTGDDHLLTAVRIPLPTPAP